MDAGAYLQRYGWRGSGHSLDKHGRGIKKPLLISHKSDLFGLGKKKAAHTVDDQWWMRAFDESLKNIGTGQQSTLSQVREKGINKGGLYGFFVKGESLVGTISNTEESSAAETSQTNSSAEVSRESTPPTSASDSSDDNESTMSGSTTTITSLAQTDGATASKNPRKRKGYQDVPRERAEKRKKLARANALKNREEYQANVVDPSETGGDAKGKDKDAKATYKADKAGRKRLKELRKEARLQEEKRAAAKAERREAKVKRMENLARALPPMNLVREDGTLKKSPSKKEKKQRKQVAEKLASLTPKGRTKYEQRAAKKNLTLEHYLLRRIEKKRAKKEEKAL